MAEIKAPYTGEEKRLIDPKRDRLTIAEKAALETQGWIPDFYDYNNLGNSRIALAPETYVPPAEGETHAGSVPALYWYVDHGQFGVGGYGANGRRSICGVRGGVRIR